MGPKIHSAAGFIALINLGVQQLGIEKGARPLQWHDVEIPAIQD
jgi:hypothetical protein